MGLDLKLKGFCVRKTHNIDIHMDKHVHTPLFLGSGYPHGSGASEIHSMTESP